MDTIKLLIKNAEISPSKPALIFKDAPVSNSQLKENVFKLADGLKKIGVKKQDKAAIYLPNCPQYCYSYLALFSLGAVVVPLDFMFKEDELISCLNHSQTKLLITQLKPGLALDEIKKRVKSLENIILVGEQGEDFHSFEAILNKSKPDIPDVKISAEDDALIMYTSGTSGNPKGVLLSYRHLSGSPEAMKYFVDLCDKDIKLCALPLSHSGGLIYLQNSLVFNIPLVLMERFSPLEFLKNIEKYKVSCFHIVPSMYYAILQLKEFQTHNLSTLRWVVVFGAPSAADVLARFNQYCPNTHLLNGWGLTETCPPNTVIPLGSRNIASVGKPAPWVEIKIFDENNNEVEPGATGEITIKSWVVMKEYYRNPADTQAAIKNGRFHTGDLGRFDQDGFLYIVGRKKETIKVSGQLVYAPEVEAAIHKHRDILEAAVIGIPDKLRGEAVKAFVVKDKTSDLCESDLRVFCQEHLAHFKVPHKIEFVNSLPKNRAGKVDKEALKCE